MTVIDQGSFRDALEQIAAIADQATQNGDGSGPVSPSGACRILPLPDRLRERAAVVAVAVNPVNAPLAQLGGDIPQPDHLTLLTSKYWGPTARRLSVSFLEATPGDLQARIVSHMNAWATRIGISFATTNGVGDVRISRGAGGYYSYLGTDIKLIPQNRQTMNLENFTMNTPESEYKRVVRHETGHTLGFPHEHMRKALVSRIDPQKAYVYFLNTYGWDKARVDAQVLTPLNSSSIIGTPADEDSIMCYQLPGEITKDGKPIRGGKDINATDYAFAARIYPPASSAVAAVNGRSDALDGAAASLAALDWDPSEDVEDVDVLA